MLSLSDYRCNADTSAALILSTAEDVYTQSRSAAILIRTGVIDIAAFSGDRIPRLITTHNRLEDIHIALNRQPQHDSAAIAADVITSAMTVISNALQQCTSQDREQLEVLEHCALILEAFTQPRSSKPGDAHSATSKKSRKKLVKR